MAWYICVGWGALTFGVFEAARIAWGRFRPRAP